MRPSKVGQQDFSDLISTLPTSYLLSDSGHSYFSPYPASEGKIHIPNALRGILWGLENVSKI